MALPQKILITGAALRTGRAIAFYLAERGAQVVLHADRHYREAQELRLILPGGGHICCAGNLADDSDVDKLCAAAFECDGIVLNASCYRHNYKGGDAAFDELLEKVNHYSAVRILQSFISGKKTQGGAAVAMLDQEISSSENNPYLESRRALWQDMKYFAQEYGKDDLRFNAVAPGPMLPPPELGDTKMVKTLPTLPLKRSVALDDVARCVSLLLENRSLTGALLFADCGQSLKYRTQML